MEVVAEVLSILFLLVLFFLYLNWINSTKDAPFEGMYPEVVERVMKLADVKKGEVFIDLGSGDGRLVIAAALHGAVATGVELDKWRAIYSRAWIRLLGLYKKATIVNGDLFNQDISKATIVTTYLLPETHERLKEKLIRELKKGTKIVAVGFEYKGWKPKKIDPRGTLYGPILMYEV